jgi:hypothetical protein
MQNMKIKHSFFAGSEEVVARFVSLIITIIGFGIYSLSKDQNGLQWNSLLALLGIFWFVYELSALILFTLFRFFVGKGDGEEDVIDTEIKEDKIK